MEREEYGTFHSVEPNHARSRIHQEDTVMDASWIMIWIPTKRHEEILGEGSRSRNQTDSNEHNNDTIDSKDHPNGKVNKALVVEEEKAKVPYYEEKLEKLLLEMNIKATSLPTKDDSHALVAFSLDKVAVEETLLSLQKIGVGNTDHTSISVIPASVHFETPRHSQQCLRFVTVCYHVRIDLSSIG